MRIEGATRKSSSGSSRLGTGVESQRCSGRDGLTTCRPGLNTRSLCGSYYAYLSNLSFKELYLIKAKCSSTVLSNTFVIKTRVLCSDVLMRNRLHLKGCNRLSGVHCCPFRACSEGNVGKEWHINGILKWSFVV